MNPVELVITNASVHELRQIIDTTPDYADLARDELSWRLRGLIGDQDPDYADLLLELAMPENDNGLETTEHARTRINLSLLIHYRDLVKKEVPVFPIRTFQQILEHNVHSLELYPELFELVNDLVHIANVAVDNRIVDYCTRRMMMQYEIEVNCVSIDAMQVLYPETQQWAQDLQNILQFNTPADCCADFPTLHHLVENIDSAAFDRNDYENIHALLNHMTL